MRNQKFGLETLRNFICGVAIDHLALPCLTPFGVTPIGITSESWEHLHITPFGVTLISVI